MSDNSMTARAIYESWEKRDYDGIVENMIEQVVFTDMARSQVHDGRAAVRDFFESWATACPDSGCGAKVIAYSDGVVVVEGVWVGTNTGPFGPFGATGQEVSMPWVNVLRFNPEGQIMAGAAYYDQLTPLTQLQHLQLPGVEV
jgi:steroid delta-isomerase-like uncharacterized protein